MVCGKCGKKLNKDENFCSVCGYYNDPENETLEEENESLDEDFFDEVKEEDEIDENEFDEVDGSNLINAMNIPDNNEINEFNTSNTPKKKKITTFKDDRLIEAFTGEDYKWIIRRPVNIYAFFLSWIYFLYRKMYIIGITGLVITGLVCRFLTSYIIPYAILVMVLSGLLFNPIYRLYANIRIKIIKKHNYGTDDFTLEQICSEKGGTNLILTLIIFFIFLLIMIRSYYSFSINTENTKFWTENSENKANCTSIARSNYRLLSDEEASGILEDSVCNVRKTNSTKSYDVYLKITNKEKNTFRIIYFKDEKESVSIEGAKTNLEELQEKNKNSTISEEELQVLNRTLEIRKEYSKIYDASKEEDLLIKKRKNKSEKTDFIITKDEIQR